MEEATSEAVPTTSASNGHCPGCGCRYTYVLIRVAADGNCEYLCPNCGAVVGVKSPKDIHTAPPQRLAPIERRPED